MNQRQKKKNQSDVEIESEWLEHVYNEEGFKSYVHFRDLQILVNIATCVDKRDFYGAVEENGRRREILRLQAESKLKQREKKKD
jgi:hypothetical protein